MVAIHGVVRYKAKYVILPKGEALSYEQGLSYRCSLTGENVSLLSCQDLGSSPNGGTNAFE